MKRASFVPLLALLLVLPSQPGFCGDQVSEGSQASKENQNSKESQASKGPSSKENQAAASEVKPALEALRSPALAPGLGDPGDLTGITVESAGAAYTVLRGPDARRQIIVTGNYSSGQVRDLTRGGPHRGTTYESSPPGIVSIDPTGLVVPLADGKAVALVRVKSLDGKPPAEITAQLELTVEKLSNAPPVNFPNQITPIFTKLGCNGGGCHGKSSGQNGFKLSLLGFYPADDYEYLVKEGRGRRIFAAAPDRSLLLLKATNTVPHGGGLRIEVGSYEYKLLSRWVEQGMPYGKADDPRVERIEVVPEKRALERSHAAADGSGPQAAGQQQVAVFAHYTDGSVEDVTRMAQYEANDTEMAEVSPSGFLKTLDLTGDVAVMVRFQGQVGVFRASIPLGLAWTELPAQSAPRNFIDQAVFAKLKALGMPPSPPCDDANFLRRVTIDIAGRLPSAEEAREFLAGMKSALGDGSEVARRDELRDQWIERLLESNEYADNFANKWSAVLRNKRANPNYARGNYAFHRWIRESLVQNKPYNQFIKEILAAKGDISEDPPVVWFRSVKTTEEQVEDTAQLFLGLRIQCARCHHHPFEKWSQKDYFSFAAFFSRVGKKNHGSQDEPVIYHNRGQAAATNPRTGESYKPASLGGSAIDVRPDDDPRLALSDWLSSPENPFFAPALVNRYWKHFFGRAIVEPEDDMRVTNPASNPELLEGLAKSFLQSGFDLKALVRTICRSRVYQLSSEPNQWNIRDKQNFSRYYPKRLTAEVLYDALNQVTGTKAGFAGLPPDTRAVQLPDSGFNNYFLTVFGKPEANSSCECERSQDANLAQSLHLLNSTEVQGKLSAADGRAALFAKDDKRSDEDRIRELYYWVYGREPLPEDLKLALAHLGKTKEKHEAYEDVLWALINTKEFLFNH